MACIPSCLGQRPTFICMMFLTSSFFLVEIIVGYATNSMALVADSFHMLSDIISLFVGFFAMKFSRKSHSNTLDANTFGWVRAEVLGALVNAVFLVALCFSILIEALKRLVEPEALNDPVLILIVGSTGLLINLIGMFLFHGHAGHGHSHGGGSHSHSHGGGSHGHSHGHDTNNKKRHRGNKRRSKKILVKKERSVESYHNKIFNPEENADHTTVAIATCNDEKDGDATIEMYMQTDGAKTVVAEIASAGSVTTTKKSKASGQMNMKGVYLHILGDALGSVIVIVAALLVYFFGEHKWTLYVDPTLSIIMVFIILRTCIPLLKESSLILLQNVPSHIQLKKLEKRLLGMFPEIIAVHDFHVWQLTGNKIVASLHIKFSSNADYKHLSPSLKEFFHDEGIHSTTVQPEYPADYSDASDDEKKCLLPCINKSCEEKMCCKTQIKKEKQDPDNTKGATNGTNLDVAKGATNCTDPDIAKGATDGTDPDKTKSAIDGTDLDVAKGPTDGTDPDIAKGATNCTDPDVAKGATSCTDPDIAKGATNGTDPDKTKGATDGTDPYVAKGPTDGTDPDIAKGATNGTDPDNVQKGKKKSVKFLSFTAIDDSQK